MPAKTYLFVPSSKSYHFCKILNEICLWNKDAPGSNKVKSGKISTVLHFWPRPNPRGIGVKCEQLLAELTVKVRLLYHYPNFIALEWDKYT